MSCLSEDPSLSKISSELLISSTSAPRKSSICPRRHRFLLMKRISSTYVVGHPGKKMPDGMTFNRRVRTPGLGSKIFKKL